MSGTTELLNSRETEMSVLGTILYDSSLFSRASTSLGKDDFYYPEHSRVYSAMEALHTDNLDINVKSVWNYLYSKSYNGITETEIRDMLDYRVDGEAFQAFTAQLAEFSGHRILASGLRKIQAELEKKTGTLDSYSSSLATLIRQVNAKDVRAEFATGEDMGLSFIEMLSRERNELAYTGIPTIDDRLVDFDGKEISYIAGRPGGGKTTMMLQSARVNLEKGARVGFLSMEMSVAKLANRLISSRARFNGEDMLKMTQAEFMSNDDLLAAYHWLKSVPLFMDDFGPFTKTSVSQKIRKMVYEHGVDVVYVDYIGLIQTEGGANRNEQLSEMSRELKGLSSELDIPLVIASQLSRDVVKRGGGRPNLADLRDSGSLEQDASIVAFLYPDTAAISLDGGQDIDAFIKDEPTIPVKFEIAKQRNGPVFTRDLVFLKTVGRFELRDHHYSTFPVDDLE